MRLGSLRVNRHKLRLDPLCQHILQTAQKQVWLIGLSALLLVLTRSASPVLSDMDQLAQRWLFQLRGAQPWDSRIVLIKIDDTSLAKLGRFPWSRDRYVEVLDILSQSHGNIAVFNVLFSEGTSQDQKFAEAIQRHGHVVLAQAWDGQKQPLRPSSILRNPAIAVGHIAKFESHHHEPNSDLLPEVDGVPSLSLASLQAYALSWPSIASISYDDPFRVNWPGPASTLTQYSFVDVIENRIPIEKFNGKIILIGLTAFGLDPFSAPWEPSGQASGVHLHAAAIHSLLQHNNLKPLPFSQFLWISLPALLLWSAMLMRLNTIGQILLWLGSLLIWILFCVTALRFNYFASMVSPLVLLNCAGLYTIFSGKIKLDHSNKILRNQAIFDHVTQVRNRQFFSTYITQVWRQSLRSHQPFSLILCDVDHFKIYNDTYGHPAGDRCLYEIAQVIQSHLSRPTDIVTRYGGEEFAIILPTTDLTGACYVAERLQAAIASLALPHRNSPVAPHITLSLGVTSFNPQPLNSAAHYALNLTLEDLTHQADVALYQAKANGRNQYCTFPDRS